MPLWAALVVALRGRPGGKLRRQIETLVAGYEAGSSTHEELVNQLVALTGGEAGRSDTGSTFTSVGINHVALAVSDVDAMAEFMGQHLGTEVIRSSATAGFLACGANNFVGLFKRAEPGYDHLCFTVEGYDADDAFARIEHAGLEAHRTENRVFFGGPDGMLFQVADTWGDYPQP